MILKQTFNIQNTGKVFQGKANLSRFLTVKIEP